MRKLILALVFTLILALAGWIFSHGALELWDLGHLSWLTETQAYLAWLTEVLYATTVVLTIIQVILENGKPSRTLAWVMVLIVLPVIGILFYLIMGGNLRKEKLFSIKGSEDLQRINQWLDRYLSQWESVDEEVRQLVGQKAPLVSLLTHNSKAMLTQENQVEVLLNGAQTFPALFQAIAEAEDHIHLEYYILEDGDLMDELVDRLVEKAEAGVTVRIMYDGVGSFGLSGSTIRRLRQAGAEILPFMSVRFPRLANRINYRNHRKIAVMDGKVGFVGGLNIADRYLSGDAELGDWRDTHLRIFGNAVKGLQLVFLTDWFFVSGDDFSVQEMFPSVEVEGELPIQIVASGPDSDYESILQGYFASIHLARDYLYIANAYLIPNESILIALKTAALSGVDLRILIPEENDSKLAYWSSQSYLDELLAAGVRIFLYQKGFLHTKTLVSDDLLCSVGTANWDHRSFEQNFEVNAFLYDAKTAQTLKQQFLEDLNLSRELTLEEFRQRPGWKKGLASLARLLSPLL